MERQLRKESKMIPLMVKLSFLEKAVPARLAAESQMGLFLVGDDLVEALSDSEDYSDWKGAIVFVAYSQVQWTASK